MCATRQIGERSTAADFQTPRPFVEHCRRARYGAIQDFTAVLCHIYPGGFRKVTPVYCRLENQKERRFHAMKETRTASQTRLDLVSPWPRAASNGELTYHVRYSFTHIVYERTITTHALRLPRSDDRTPYIAP